MYQKQVSFGEAITLALKKNYCNFSGRASRSEYWWYTLFSTILSAVATIATISSPMLSNIVSTILGLGLLLPNLGIVVRRFHDIGHSGWWYLAYFVVVVTGCILIALGSTDAVLGGEPMVGMIVIGLIFILAAVIWMLVWLCKPSVQGDNEYGSEPNMVDEDGNEIGEKYSF